METSACPSCGHAHPVVRTRAMHACPHCGRPMDDRAEAVVATPPPSWLGDDTSTAPARDPSDEVVHAAEAAEAVDRGMPARVDSVDRDPLSGWDVARDTPPDRGGTGVADWHVAVVATSVGATVGAAVARRGRRGPAVAIGGLLGLLGAAAARQLWTIEAPDATWARRHPRESRST